MIKNNVIRNIKLFHIAGSLTDMLYHITTLIYNPSMITAKQV